MGRPYSSEHIFPLSLGSGVSMSRSLASSGFCCLLHSVLAFAVFDVSLKFQPHGNSLAVSASKGAKMALHPKSKIAALRALLAVTRAEERRLLTIINSDQTSAEEMLTALNDLSKLWSNIALKIADIEDSTLT